MMKAQVHVSKSSAISDIQAHPRRKHYCQTYQMIRSTSANKPRKWCQVVKHILRGRLLASFQDLEHEGGDTRIARRYQANPKESHLIAVKRIFRYLKGTLSLGLWYPKCLGFDLKGYSDSDYTGCKMDRKSTSRACQFLGGKLVCWSAKKKQSVAMSSAEAEYVAAVGWYREEIRAKGIRKKSCLTPRWRLLMAQIMQCLGGKTGGLDQIANKDATILYCLANGVKETKFSLAKVKSSSHHLTPTPVVGEMHKKAQQAASGLTSLGATSEEGAHPQLSSGNKNYSFDHIFARSNLSVLVDKTKSARDGLKTAHTGSGANEVSKANDILLKVKLEDLSNILKETRSAFFTPDSLLDEPIIVLDKSEEEEAQQAASGLTSLGATSEEGAHPQLSSDNCKKGLGYENYHAVSPPYTENFMPIKLDLSFTGLDKFVKKPVVKNYEGKSSEKVPKVVKKNNDARIIKEWVLDNKEDEMTQPKIMKKIVKPSIPKIEFVKPRQQEKTTRKLLSKLRTISKTLIDLEAIKESGTI
nr:uncharacterized mitochondrial protein AtMg00810-like [Tanacetum cinerariifolium]